MKTTGPDRLVWTLDPGPKVGEPSSRPLCPEKGCINLFVRPKEGAPFGVHSHYDQPDHILPELIDHCAEILSDFRRKVVVERAKND